MAAAPSDAEMREYVTTHADSDLQFILQDSAVSLRVQHQIAQGYPTLKRFSALGDTRAEVRTAAMADFGLDPTRAHEGAQKWQQWFRHGKAPKNMWLRKWSSSQKQKS